MKSHGLTLVELLIVVAVLVALSAIVLPTLGQTTSFAEEKTTLATMTALRDSIIGNDRASGYYEDMREWPRATHDLLLNDRMIASSDPIFHAKRSFDINTRIGWNGPYVHATNPVFTIVDSSSPDYKGFAAGYFCAPSSMNTDIVVTDAWGNPIVLQQALTLAPLGSANINDPEIRLRSAGPDKILNTADDIILPIKRAGTP